MYNFGYLSTGDAFDIRIAWNRETAILTSTFAVAGTLIGSYAGGRMGAVLGASIGGATGFGMSSELSILFITW